MLPLTQVAHHDVAVLHQRGVVPANRSAVDGHAYAGFRTAVGQGQRKGIRSVRQRSTIVTGFLQGDAAGSRTVSPGTGGKQLHVIDTGGIVAILVEEEQEPGRLRRTGYADGVGHPAVGRHPAAVLPVDQYRPLVQEAVEVEFVAKIIAPVVPDDVVGKHKAGRRQVTNVAGIEAQGAHRRIRHRIIGIAHPPEVVARVGGDALAAGHYIPGRQGAGTVGGYIRCVHQVGFFPLEALQVDLVLGGDAGGSN